MTKFLVHLSVWIMLIDYFFIQEDPNNCLVAFLVRAIKMWWALL